MPKHDQGGKIKDVTSITEKKDFKGIVFESGSDNASDLLVNAMAITRFLTEVSTVINYKENALTEDASHGLYLILTGLEDTLHAVAERI
jgi:hypothetical protein